MPSGIYIRTEETRKKMSEAHVGEKHFYWGRPRKEETKKKISETLKKNPVRHWEGKHRTPETKRKISEAQKGEKNHSYGKHPAEETRKKLSEAHIGLLAGENHPLWGKYHSKETKEKMRENHADVAGENNPNWLGGKSFEPYTLEFNRELKDLIRSRDGYKCQKCGCPEIESNKKLTCHHIDYNKKNCEPNNLITLCMSCNIKVNFNREYYIEHFQRKTKETMNLNYTPLWVERGKKCSQKKHKN